MNDIKRDSPGDSAYGDLLALAERFRKCLPSREEEIEAAIALLDANGYIVGQAIDERPSGSPRFLELLEEMRETHIAKNAGYAGSDNPDHFANFRECEDLNVSAFLGCLVRMGDKWKRIKNLAKDPNNERVGEAITDTLLDLANYALIATILYEQENAGRAAPEQVESVKMAFGGILSGLGGVIANG